MFGQLAAKQVGLLRELVPGATLIAFLVNPSNPITERNVRDAVDAAQKLGEKIEIVHASSEAEIDAAFDTLRGMRASALLVQPDARLVKLMAHRPRFRAGHTLPVTCISPPSWSLRCALISYDQAGCRHRIG